VRRFGLNLPDDALLFENETIYLKSKTHIWGRTHDGSLPFQNMLLFGPIISEKLV